VALTLEDAQDGQNINDRRWTLINADELFVFPSALIGVHPRPSVFAFFSTL
jgi:hypothetical protein